MMRKSFRYIPGILFLVITHFSQSLEKAPDPFIVFLSLLIGSQTWKVVFDFKKKKKNSSKPKNTYWTYFFVILFLIYIFAYEYILALIFNTFSLHNNVIMKSIYFFIGFIMGIIALKLQKEEQPSE